MPRKDVWTREQTIIAFNLYCKIPWGQAHSRNKNVQEVAAIIGRSPSAVARKLGNFGSLDPELRRRNVGGLPNRSKLDEEIWNEFHENWNALTLTSTELIAQYKQETIEQVIDIDEKELPKGADRRRFVKTRVYQDFFRKAVFAAYENTCCITGMKITALQVASHIIPWSKNEANRTNPENGLCINALHDKAFDCGLITILPDFTIRVSKQIENKDSNLMVKNVFTSIDKKPIIKPHKFLPEKNS